MLINLFQIIKRLQQTCYPWGNANDFWLGIITSALLIQLLSLLFPITIMQIYHHVIPNKDFTTLLMFISLLVVATILIGMLRLARNTIANWNDARHSLQYLTSEKNSTLPHTVYNPTSAKNRAELINLFFASFNWLLLVYLNYWLAIVPLLCLTIFLPLAKLFNTKESMLVSTNSQILYYRAQIDKLSSNTLLNTCVLLTVLSVTWLGTFLVLTQNFSAGALAASILLTFQFMLSAVKFYQLMTFATDLVVSDNTPNYLSGFQTLLSSMKIDSNNLKFASAQKMSLNDVKYAMCQLGYDAYHFSIKLKFIDPRLYPGIFITSDHKIFVLLEKTKDDIKLFNADTTEIMLLSDANYQGDFYFFKIKNSDESNAKRYFSGLRQTFRHTFGFTLLVNFFSSLLLLSLPLILIVIYDEIIRTQALSSVLELSVGTLLIILGFFLLQWLGSQLSSLKNSQVIAQLQRLVNEPTTENTEKTEANPTTLKKLNDLKKFIIHSSPKILFSLPLALIAGSALLILSIKLFLLTGLSIVAFILLLYFGYHKIQRTLTQYNSKNLPNTPNVLAQQALSTFRRKLSSDIIAILCDSIFLLSLILSLFVGTIDVMHGKLSLGELLASIVLIAIFIYPFTQLGSTLRYLIRFKQNRDYFSHYFSLANQGDV